METFCCLAFGKRVLSWLLGSLFAKNEFLRIKTKYISAFTNCRRLAGMTKL